MRIPMLARRADIVSFILITGVIVDIRMITSGVIANCNSVSMPEDNQTQDRSVSQRLGPILCIKPRLSYAYV